MRKYDEEAVSVLWDVVKRVPPTSTTTRSVRGRLVGGVVLPVC